jgi:hypothetical protein
VKTKLTLDELQKITLARGAHESREKGVCAMEAVAWLAGRPHSDRPPCVAPVLGDFVRSWNDGMADEPRQRLKVYLPRLLDTAGDPEVDKRRSQMAWEWVLSVSVPTWLEAAGLKEHADALRRDGEKALEPARKAAVAAGAAAGAAAWAAAWAAAGAAARDAAGAAARAAARAAAGAAAGAAARAAARAAAGAAARDAAWAAARDAAWAALAPTVLALQESAFDLLDRMINVRSGSNTQSG